MDGLYSLKMGADGLTVGTLEVFSPHISFNLHLQSYKQKQRYRHLFNQLS